MTDDYRVDKLQSFRSSETWGLCVTDAFGMGMDLPDVKVVVQYRATCDMCTLWQRFGRAARGEGVDGIGVLLIEKKNTSEEREAAAERAQNRKKKKKKAGKRKRTQGTDSPAKRPALLDRQTGSPIPTRLQPSSSQILGMSDNSDSDVDSAIEESANEPESDVVEVEGEDLEAKMLPKGKGKKKKSKGAAVEVGDAMDLFINPKVECGRRCRRTSPKAYFGHWDGGAADSKYCNMDESTGCLRCLPPTTTICCDLCSPKYFEHMGMSSHEEDAGTRALAKSNVGRLLQSDWTEHDWKLLDALIVWRQKMSLNYLSAQTLNDYGPEALMSDDHIERLVQCFHYQKVTTLEHLKKELDWNGQLIEKNGASLVQLMISFYPPVPPTSGKKPRRCTACQQEGHISESEYQSVYAQAASLKPFTTRVKQ
ncbi:hypothetical protein BKA70DRAFT_1447887 [Coprinopsis sp. MPI-PUGE-AT-0042]|nr:hypothetical protein BKA70DRAFT_1447887 [Coprinopsis sp. MPI-PUGE-AT-0042]